MAPIKVCIVEDLQDVREGISAVLKMDDRFELLSVYANAEIATRDLPAWQPHIVIMDINLPGMSGIDCIKRVKAECPNTQFMIFTVYEDEDKVFQALAAGASSYLLKKTSLSKIVDSLIELHEGGSPMSTQIARKIIEVYQKQNEEVVDEGKTLSNKEYAILELLAKGHLYKEISVMLSISVNTVKQHIHNIYQKLQVKNRTEAINKVFRN